MEPLSTAPPSAAPPTRVTYIHDADVGNYSYGYGHPMKPHRMRMTHNLVANYGLQRHMHLVRPARATREQMTAFHTDEYVDFLSRVTPESVTQLTGDGTRFLIGEDCPAFSGLFEFCTISAGGSLAAASALNAGTADVAINWAGGLHHAKKREASGFCYVNDIVLAILELLRTHLRVLYIDIDIHHGDGVEEAFYTTDRVMTVSFHKFGDFFPGTGDVRDVGMKRGKGYAVNVPLKDGVGEKEFAGIFRPVLQHIMDWYRPGAVVLQCGADSLAGDKLGCFNLSMRGHADCVSFMKSFGVPLICLGGGGYTIRNVARTWTYETGLLVGQELDEDLPFNEYMQYFGPEYKLDVPMTSMENQNSREYLEGLLARIIDNLRCLNPAPSVQMQETPRNPLNPAELDVSDDEDSDLDERINQRLRDAHVERYGDELSGDEDDEGGDMDLDGLGSSRRPSTHGMVRNWSHLGGGTSRVGGDLGARYGSGSRSLMNGLGRASPSGSTFGAPPPGGLGMGFSNGHAASGSSGSPLPPRPKRSFFAARAKKPSPSESADVTPRQGAAPRPQMPPMIGRATAVDDLMSEAGGAAADTPLGGSPRPSSFRDTPPAHMLAT